MNRTFHDGCKWELHLNGEHSTYESDQALDSYLSTLDSYLNNLELPFATLFSAKSAMEIAVENLEKARIDVQNAAVEIIKVGTDPTETESFLKIQNSIGVTRFLTQEGFVPEFKLEEWRKNRKELYKQGYRYAKDGVTKIYPKDKNGNIIDLTKDENGRTRTETEIDTEIERLIAKEEASWEQLTETGTAIHKIFEDVGNGIEPKMGTDLARYMTEDQFNDLARRVKTFYKEVQHRFPGCKIYNEFALMSKSLSPEMRDKLSQMGINSINGKIDMLVIDDKGKAHIYDFKVSRKAVGDLSDKDKSILSWWNETSNEVLDNHDFWSSSKKMAASYQLSFYTELLQQYGIQVNDVTILPIQPEFEYEKDGYTIKKIKDCKFDFNNIAIKNMKGVRSGKYKNDAEKVFGRSKQYSGKQNQELNNLTSEIFPINATLAKLQEERQTVDYYITKRKDIVRKVQVGEKEYNEGYEYIFTPRFIPGGKRVAVKNKEELVKHLQDYIQNLEDLHADKCADIAQRILEAKDELDIEKFLDGLPEVQGNFLKLQFERYFDNSWNFEYNEDLNAAGIFVFSKQDETLGKVYEIVSIANSKNSLRLNQNLGEGTTILGKNTKDKYVNNARILEANDGSMNAMRVMAYIALNTSDYSDGHISEVRVINPWGHEEMFIENSRLVENYEALCSKNSDVNLPKLKRSLFLNDVPASVFGAIDRAQCVTIGLDGLAKGDTKYASEMHILALMKKLKAVAHLDFDHTTGDANYQNSEEWIAYKKLAEAYNFIHGFRTTIESDKEDWFTSKSIKRINGLMISSAQFSPSSNIRELGRMIDEYAQEVRTQVYNKGLKMQFLLRDIYKKYGNGTQAFKNWFLRDENGNLDPRFMLRDPNDPIFNGDPKVREAMFEFLDTLAMLKHPKFTKADLETYRTKDEYREVPLMMAADSRQIKGLGIWQWLKNKWDTSKVFTQQLFKDEDVNLGQFAQESGHLYNHFEVNREDRLADNDINVFETNLEVVFNSALLAYTKANVSEKYVPIISGMRLCLNYIDTYGGNKKANMENVRKIFDKMVKSKFYEDTIISENLHHILRYINFVKSIFTTLNLSLNVRSMLRESLQGLYTGASRAGVKMLPGVDEKTYIDAVTYVVQEVPKSFSGVSKLQQLNAYYGMANQSLSQIANQRRVNWANIKNWGKDTLFLTATSPDFLHRMSILIAKMKADNCWDAYKMVDGQLVYDFKSDPRFKDYLANNTNSPDYLSQRSLYLTMLEIFNAEGFRNEDGSALKEGDDLPQAYTKRDAQTFKNYADLLYGHYDDTSRSLLCDTFLGSIALQYKTFITAKFEQWMMNPGVYNTEMLKEQRDEKTGELLYQTFYEDDFGAHRDLITESAYNALSDEEKAKYIQYFDYTGMPMEGMLHESISFANALIHLDGEKLKKLWADPVSRAQFKLMLHDQFLAMLMLFFANFIFGNLSDSDSYRSADVRKAIKKMGPIENLSYNVIAGSMEDSRLDNILKNFSNDPPVWSSLQRFGNSTIGVITGDISAATWATKNLGIARDFQGLAENLNGK